ncbi:T9SS type A sorting domain-containing protein [Flavobacterium sp.]|uniref:poly(ethylene terephthalate) hydrolase family protein n=1 Tax=Flavobacterium sp. TaxID=239 RepID=UPI0025CBBB5C|nr:T9SS type A sorting domain-containing protein [Flavobacterium sp.]
MKNIKLFAAFSLLLLVNYLSLAQPFQIGHTTINFTDTTRNNRVIATEIYYPSDSAGDNVALTSSTNLVFPLLSFGHGFVMTWDVYQNYWSLLVPKGYIMVFPKTEGSLSPSHLDFGKDLSFALNQMTILNSNAASIFYNRISSMNAVMGHSMGGGASFLAAQLNPNIKSLINFAAAETNPSAIQSAAGISIPSLIFSGANDCVAPSNTNQIPMYLGLASTCKTLVTIMGGSHCQMANSNFFCGIGESTCTPQPAITRTEQQNIINNYLLPWLDYQLKGNCVQGAIFDTQILTDNAITYQKNCNQCTNLSNTNLVNENKVKLSPNPAKEYIGVTGILGEKYQIKIYDISGKTIITKEFTTETTIETSNLVKGIYIYHIDNQVGFTSNGKFIK